MLSEEDGVVLKEDRIVVLILVLMEYALGEGR